MTNQVTFIDVDLRYSDNFLNFWFPLPDYFIEQHLSPLSSLNQIPATHLQIGTRRWNLRLPDIQMSCKDLAA